VIAVANTKNLIAKVSYGDLKVELIAEGAVWNPDIADDLIKRVKNLWQNSLQAMSDTNAWEMVDSNEEEDDG
jgi:hypothetical protein